MAPLIIVVSLMLLAIVIGKNTQRVSFLTHLLIVIIALAQVVLVLILMLRMPWPTP